MSCAILYTIFARRDAAIVGHFPASKARRAARNGRIDIVARRVGDVGEHRTGGRIDVVVGGAVRGVAPRAADE